MFTATRTGLLNTTGYAFASRSAKPLLRLYVVLIYPCAIGGARIAAIDRQGGGGLDVGGDHDTAAFAVESIRRWWWSMGCTPERPA